MGSLKPKLSFWQIWNMSFGFLGIQFGFELQNSNVSRIFETLGANKDDIPILWIAAPLTGLVVQPIIGYISDRTWHPFWGNDAFPRIGALNTGTPFQPFNRSPQVRLDYKTGAFTLSATGLYQQQYLSVGPVGSSNTYKRDAVIPETVLSFEYNKKAVTLGAGVDFNRIKPRVSTTGSDAKIYMTDECLNSTSFVGYGKYAKGKLMMLLKGYYGQNMAHLTMVGGYGVATYNPVNGNETYTNITSYSTLFNITYGTKWKPGLLIGYLENLGSSDPLANKSGKADIWGCGTNIMNMSRVSPSISYSVPKFLLTAEYERTTAAYGVGALNFDDGLYADTHSVTNNGIRLIMTWFF